MTVPDDAGVLVWAGNEPGDAHEHVSYVPCWGATRKKYHFSDQVAWCFGVPVAGCRLGLQFAFRFNYNVDSGLGAFT